MSVCSKRNLDVQDENAPVTFTENAADRVLTLITEEGNPNLKLRAYIEGGGCSGLQYGFSFEERVDADDTVYTVKGVTFLVNSKSLQYLAGATIDYVNDLSGERFVIENPNAKSTCGCGTSFDIEETG